MKYLIGLLLIGMVLVAGCSQQDNTIKIGGAFALTGAAADWGQDELKAADIAIEELNSAGGIDGKQVSMITEDTKSDNTGTLNAIQKLIYVDKVPAIIGPTWGDSFGSIVAPLGEQNKVVQLTPSGALEVAEDGIDYPYFFSTWYPQKPEVDRHMEFLKSRNYTRVVIIHDQDAFNTKFSQLYAEAAAENGVNITKIFEVPLGTKDFRTVVALAKEYDPDVVVLQIFEIGEIGSAVKNVQELGMNAKVMATASAQTSNLIESYGDYVEGNVIFSYPDSSSVSYSNFLRKYSEKYGKEPSGASAAAAYDATRIMLEALKHGKTGEEIKNLLYSIKINGTIVDELSFNHVGQISSAPFVMKTVRNGTFVVMD